MDLAAFISSLIKQIAALFGSSPTLPPQPTVPVGQPPQPIHQKVLLVIYNPTVPSQNNRKLSEVLGWNDPDTLIQSFIADIQYASYGYANFTIAERIEANRFPIKSDGFAYSPDNFVQNWKTQSGFHDPDAVNYQLILNDFNIVSKINDGSIDEVWLMGFPYAGFRESRIGGPGAFFCNGEVIPNVPTSRRFVIMGFSYQRGVGEMFESMAHRAESIMTQAFRNTSGTANLWQRFILYDKIAPGNSEVGSVHYAPNSQTDYDWGNPRNVLSRCSNWYSFPDLSGQPVSVNCSEWGNGDIRLHHIWWLRHFPHLTGETNMISYNWWKYIIDPNNVR
jgi:hypothetical protein